MTQQPDPEPPASQPVPPEPVFDPAVVSDMTDAFITIKRDDSGIVTWR